MLTATLASLKRLCRSGTRAHRARSYCIRVKCGEEEQRDAAGCSRLDQLRLGGIMVGLDPKIDSSIAVVQLNFFAGFESTLAQDFPH